MTVRTFVRLLVLLAVLVGAAWWLNRPPAKPGVVDGVASGDPVFPGLDVNAVTSIHVTGRDGSVRVRRGDEGWTVEELYGYPANFSVLAQFLRKLNDLEVGQALRDGEAALDELALNPEGDSSEFLAIVLERSGEAPVSFTLGARKQARASDDMGMGQPQGRFMRGQHGPVLLVDELFLELSPSALEWIDRDLIQLPAEDIVSVNVRTGMDAYSLSRDGASGFVIDVPVEHETVEASAALRLFQGLQWFRFDSVLDPESTDEEVGMAQVDTVTFKTSGDMAYELQIGRGEETSPSRTVRVGVTDVSTDQIHAAEVEQLNRRLSGWRYQVPAAVAGPLTPPRSSLVTRKQPEPEPEPESDHEDAAQNVEDP